MWKLLKKIERVTKVVDICLKIKDLPWRFIMETIILPVANILPWLTSHWMPLSINVLTLFYIGWRISKNKKSTAEAIEKPNIFSINEVKNPKLIPLIHTIISKLDNLFSEKYTRNLYAECGFSKFYTEFQNEFTNVISISTGALSEQEPINIFLKNLEIDLEKIESENIGVVLPESIDIVLNMQRKYLKEFLDIKTNFIKKYLA